MNAPQNTWGRPGAYFRSDLRNTYTPLKTTQATQTTRSICGEQTTHMQPQKTQWAYYTLLKKKKTYRYTGTSSANRTNK